MSSKKRPNVSLTVKKTPINKRLKVRDTSNLINRKKYKSIITLSPDDILKLTKILKIVLRYNSSNPDLYDYFTPIRVFSIKIGKRRDVIYSLLSCLVSKRYEKASKLMTHLCVEFQGKDHIFFYGTFKLLDNSSCISTQQIHIFIRNSLHLRNFNKREIILEFMMSKLKNNDYELPRESITRLLSFRQSLRQNETIDTLYLAYLSLYDYIAWAKFCNFSIKNPVEFSEDIQVDEGSRLKDQFVEGVSDFISQEGAWDIFVIKIRQMLEYYNELDKCEEILESFLYANFEHLHAHVYLYDFLQKYDRSKKQQKEALLNVVKISPSDILALDLVPILIEDFELDIAISVLYEFLEYPQNKNNLLAWQLLTNLGIQCLEKLDMPSLKVMRKNWKYRRSYWPLYHFDQYTIDESIKTNGKCVICKCIFLLLVTKSTEDDLSYVELVKAVFQIENAKHFKTLKKKLDYVQYLLKNNMF